MANLRIYLFFFNVSLDSPGSTKLQVWASGKQRASKQTKQSSPQACAVVTALSLPWCVLSCLPHLCHPHHREHFLSSLLCASCCTLGSERAAGKTHDVICPPYFTVCLSSLYFAHRKEMGLVDEAAADVYGQKCSQHAKNGWRCWLTRG